MLVGLVFLVTLARVEAVPQRGELGLHGHNRRTVCVALVGADRKLLEVLDQRLDLREGRGVSD